MRRFLLAILALAALASVSRANQAARGWCEDGGQVVITSGLTSSTQVQQSFPTCTVTVFVHGGGLATIFSDNNATPTPLANPFTAQVNGQWNFYAANGRYDIQLSGAGFPSPVTYSDVTLFDGGAGGIVFGVYNGPTPFSSSPVFNAATASIFQITLTGSNSSSSVNAPVQNGQVIEIYICQDPVGGRPWVWPLNFTNTSQFTLSTVANACSPTSWWFDGANWNPFTGGSSAIGVIPASQGGTGTATPTAFGVAVSQGSSTPFAFILPSTNGQCFMSAPSNFATTLPSYQTCPTGSGGTSAGPQGTIQEAGASAGSFAVSPLLDVGGAGTLVTNSADFEPCGANPFIDIRCKGAVALNISTAPYKPGITATMSSSSATATISSASTFVNLQGVAVLNAGTAHSLSTPAAPTVTSIVAAAPAPSGYVVAAAAGGSETTCYKVAAFNATQGMTAASPETCVTGQTRGFVSFSSLSNLVRSANTLVTVTTASAHTISVGDWVYIHGTTNDPEYAGYFIVTTVPDNTHFTYQWSRDSRAGASTVAASGGSATVLQGNQLLIAGGAPPAGVFQYAIYRGASGAETLADVSGVVTPGISLDSSYMKWEDFGTTYTTVPNLPAFIPTTPPTSATNNSLITTICSGAGTTTLTLCGSASNAVTNTTILADNAPNILATFAAALSAKAMVYIPVVASGSFGTNSVLDLSSYGSVGVSVAGPLYLGDTMVLGTGGVWHGDITPASVVTTSFSIQGLVPITISAKPGITANTVNMFGLALTPQGTNCQDIFIAPGSIPTATFENMAFLGSPSGSDFSCVPFIAFTQGNAGASAAGLKLTNILTKGPAQGWAPLMMFKNFGEINTIGLMEAGRGIFVSNCPTCTITGASFNVQFENQGPTMPLFVTRGTVGLGLSGVIEDTGAQPIVAHLGSGPLTVSGIGSAPSSGMSAVTGANISSVSAGGLTDKQVGVNVNLTSYVSGAFYDGSFSTPGQSTNQALDILNVHTIQGAGYSFFTAPGSYAAPTCTVATAGPPFSMSQFGGGAVTLGYAPIFPNGGQGIVSPTVTCTVDGATQQATFTIPAAVPGAGSYQMYFGFGGGLGNAWTLTQTALSFLVPSCTQFCQGQSTSAFPGGGPAGFRGTFFWGDIFPNAPNNVQNALPSFNSGGKLIATPCVPTTAGSLCDFSGSAWATFAGNSGSQAIFEESAAGVPSWVAAPLGSLVGTGQSNTFATGVQDFSAVTEFRPKSGTTAAIPATCTGPSPMDVYIATDAQAGRNWYFCTATNTWTQQVNTGVLGLNTYSGAHTALATESWMNFTATATATIPHLLILNKWVAYCTSTCTTLTLAPDAGNITLNGVTAATVTISTGGGAEVECDGSNCFAYGFGSASGSGTVSSGTVNGMAYYSAATTVASAAPSTAPNGVPAVWTSTASGGVSQPPVVSLPGIVGRAVSGITAVDTILSTDCNPNRVEYIGSVAVAVTLPTATTLGVPKCVFKLVNTTIPAQTVTITPTTWTINGNATLNLTFGQQLWVYVDPNSATNWVADQTDLFGNVSGAAVPASAKLIGTNSSSQLIAAALSNTHIYVGNGSNLPVDVAASGDVSLANTGAFTVIGVNGAGLPASASLVGTNSSKQIIAATGHSVALPLLCADTSGSASVQVCNTTPSFTPAAGDTIIYTTTTALVGTSLTVNVNSLGAKPVAKWQTTTTLASNDVRANTEVLMTYDGTNWELSVVGNSPAGGGQNPCTTTALSLQYDNAGNFGCVTEFTYASSTITVANPGKIDLSGGSVTAALLLPKAAAAAPTNGGILSYDTTTNDLVWGNATNTSYADYVTAAPTANTPVIFNGTNRLTSSGYTFSAGTVTSGHLACYTSSGTVGNCTGLGGVLGVFVSSTLFLSSGEISVTLDTTQNVTFGDNLCASSSSFGTAHDNGVTACTTGLGIGIVKTTASSVSSATAFVALR